MIYNDLLSGKKKMAVIGLGYVGLPLMLNFTDKGFAVLGFDIDAAKVEKLNRGESYIGHIPSSQIKARREQTVKLEDGEASPLFAATTDYSRAKAADVLLLCVPTPLDGLKFP